MRNARQKHSLDGSLFRLVLLLAVFLAPGLSLAGELAAPLAARLAVAGSNEQIPVIIRFAGRIDLTPFRQRHDRGPARKELVQALRGQAAAAQANVQQHLRRQGHPFTALWISNAIAAELPAPLVATLAGWPGVASIEETGTTPPPKLLPQVAPLVTGWNQEAVGAPALWSLPFDGSGVTVAVLDTGVNPDHVELSGQYRGGAGDWFDPYGSTTVPYDIVSPLTGLEHGTAVTSVILGSNVGIAPGAQWIAAKIFPDSGDADNAKILAAFQWALDPDGNPLTDDAPDIVNGSWGFESSPNLCLPNFRSEIQTLQAAGIHVVFAAGNLGPNSATSVSPANLPEGLAVGATGADGSVSRLSSRGPTPCVTAESPYLTVTGSDVFPELVAPGDGVIVANSFSLTGYSFAAGTSLAAPHVSGALALLRQAHPNPGQPAETYRLDLELALLDSAADLDTPGPDQSAGYGQLDAAAAFYRLDGQPSLSLYTPGTAENDDVVDFGNVPLGTSRDLDLRLVNVGTGTLTLTDISAVAAPFSVLASDCPAALLGDAACTVTLRFAPTAPGPVTGNSLTIASNDPRTPSRIVTLAGSGNTAPPAARLIAPANGALNQPTTLTFSWYQGDDADGDSLTTTLYLDDNAIFFSPTPYPLASALPAAALLTLLPVAWLLRRDRLVPLVALLLVSALLSCGGAGGAPAPAANRSLTLTGLAPGTEYFWKVETRDGNGNPVTSEVRSFTTAP